MDKALDILNKVGKMKSYAPEAIVNFEYGNSTFHTAQLIIEEINSRENQLMIKLAIEPTDCKAKELCGLPEKVAIEADNSCAPGSGCC